MSLKKSDMNEINEEIKLTIDLIQSDICAGLRDEMQKHLNGLLEIKRNEYKQRLVERSWTEPVTHDRAPYKRVKLEGQVEAKPLTAEELRAGGWWCADVSADALKVFKLYGLVEYSNDSPWGRTYYACFLYKYGSNLIDRGYESHTNGLKEIKRIGNEFYWCE